MADEARDNQSSGNKRALTVGGYGYSTTYGQQPNGTGWFGPLRPLLPVAPTDVKGRVLDFQSGYNLNLKPRAYEPVTFQMLRSFADSFDVLRLVIETRKDQLGRLDWNISARDYVTKDKMAGLKGKAEEIEKFFIRPDKKNFWDEWLRMLLEDLFVIDAPAIYKRKTYGGDLYALQLLDGGTIKRVIDDLGNTPEPPNPAYQQILKGLPAVDYTTDELMYRPRNIRTHKVYGFSHVEQIIMTIQIALRRQVWQLQSFTEGNVPEALIGTPMTWTPDQIKQFQDWFDSQLQGNTGERRRARFVPGDVAKAYVSTKPDELFGLAEEWLARVVCFCFSISPQPFVKMMNRATAQTAQETAVEEGLAPIQNYIKNIIDTIIIEDFGCPDLEFKWADEDELDPNIRSQIDDREMANGQMTYNEIRIANGKDPIVHPNADRPLYRDQTGVWQPLFLTDEEQAEKDALTAALTAPPTDTPPGDDEPPGGTSPGQDGASKDGKTSKKPATKAPAAKEVAEKSDRPFPESASSLSKGEWDEDAHPRDEKGKFEGGGGDGHGGSDPTGHGSDNAKATVVLTDWDKHIINDMKDTINRLQAAIEGKQDHELVRPKIGDSGMRPVSEWKRDIAQNERWIVEIETGVNKMAKAAGVSTAHGKEYVDPERAGAKKAQKAAYKKIKAALAAMAPVVAKQVEEKLKALGKADDEIDIEEILKNLHISFDAEMLDELEDVYQTAGAAGLAQLGVKVGSDLVNQINDRAVDWAEGNSADLVTGIEEATRDMLRGTIAAGLAENLSAEDIASNIEDGYAFSEDRAMLIATTEIAAANSEGALAGYEEAAAEGLSVKKSWLILDDACDDCQENADAGSIELDEQFPSGDDAPPAHPNCRCVLVPEVEDAAGNETEGEEDSVDEG